MRLWSLHPRYLDRQGLTACWREALLAQAVLAGSTRGYTRHPQLERFRACGDPLRAVGGYLGGVLGEAAERGYAFDLTLIREPGGAAPIVVTEGQLRLEWSHLLRKLQQRSPQVAARWEGVDQPAPHPAFVVVPGPVAEWERATV